VGAPVTQGQRHIGHAKTTAVSHELAGERHFATFGRILADISAAHDSDFGAHD
jgi:hypothetical protein